MIPTHLNNAKELSLQFRLLTMNKEQVIESINNNNIKRVELIINVGNDSYTTCSMNFDIIKKEFYYHFTYPKNIKNKIWNNNCNKIAGRYDHITYHANGCVQLSRKDETKKIHQHMMSDYTFLSKDNNTITPLLVHSIFSIEGKFVLPLFKEKENVIINHFNLMPNITSFSIILFLTPDKLNINDFLNHIWYEHPLIRMPASFLGNPAGQILAWYGWSINYMITDLTIKASSNLKPNPSHCMFAYSNLPPVLRDLLLQRVIPSFQTQ